MCTNSFMSPERIIWGFTEVLPDMTLHPMTFPELAGSIRQVHNECIIQVGRAVNISLTLRNWVMGFYIEEYEQSSSDRAEYGERLMDRLAETLSLAGIPRCERRDLYRYRKFYQTYPRIVQSLTPQCFGCIDLTKDIPP
jgi:hypothetical protein